MNILAHAGAALAYTDALHAESHGTIRFFDTAKRARADFGWGPRGRRRERMRRRNQ